MNFSFPYKTKLEKIQFSGTGLEFESIESMDDTIDAFFEEYQRSGREELFADLCPYFGQLWPAGRILAEVSAKKSPDWRGKRILEIGCGLALPSLFLAKLGCQVTAIDLHPDVPVFLERNMARNEIAGLTCRLEDWRKLEDEEVWDIVIGSDILYDREQPQQLLAFLEKRASKQTEIILTDPGRVYFNRFLRDCQRAGWQIEEEIIGDAFLVRIRK